MRKIEIQKSFSFIEEKNVCGIDSLALFKINIHQLEFVIKFILVSKRNLGKFIDFFHFHLMNKAMSKSFVLGNR